MPLYPEMPTFSKSRIMTATWARFAASATSVKSLRKASVVDVLTVIGGGGTILPPAATAAVEDDDCRAAACCDAFIVDVWLCVENICEKKESDGVLVVVEDGEIERKTMCAKDVHKQKQKRKKQRQPDK